MGDIQSAWCIPLLYTTHVVHPQLRTNPASPPLPYQRPDSLIVNKLPILKASLPKVISCSISGLMVMGMGGKPYNLTSVSPRVLLVYLSFLICCSSLLLFLSATHPFSLRSMQRPYQSKLVSFVYHSSNMYKNKLPHMLHYLII